MPIIPAAKEPSTDYLAAMILMAWAEAQGGWRQVKVEALITVWKQIKEALKDA